MSSIKLIKSRVKYLIDKFDKNTPQKPEEESTINKGIFKMVKINCNLQLFMKCFR